MIDDDDDDEPVTETAEAEEDEEEYGRRAGKRRPITLSTGMNDPRLLAALKKTKGRKDDEIE
jgi:hypothetical protein